MTDESTSNEPHIVTMNRLRERLLVLGQHGAIVGEGNRNFLNATLNQILKEIENDRIRYESAAERLERQAAAERAKVEACRAFRSLVFNVVDKFALAAEADATRDAEIAALEAEAMAETPQEDSEEEVEYEYVEEEVEEEEEEVKSQPEEKPPKPRKRGTRRRKKV